MISITRISVSALGCVCGLAVGQTVQSVKPLQVVPGEETRFVVEGTNFPHKLPAHLGMKFITVPAKACANPQRYQAVTPTGYYFSCSFDKSFKGPVAMKILVKPTAGSEKILWQGEIHAVSQGFSVDRIVLKSNGPEHFVRMACLNGSDCLQILGLPKVGRIMEIEIEGKRLQEGAELRFEPCQTTSGKKLIAANGDRITQQCTPTKPGSYKLSVAKVGSVAPLQTYNLEVLP